MIVREMGRLGDMRFEKRSEGHPQQCTSGSSGKSISSDTKLSTMARNRSIRTKIFLFLLFLVAFGAFAPVFAPLPSLSSSLSSHHNTNKVNVRKFKIAEDMFWKDGKPFQIIGGDLHYFRVLPEVDKWWGILLPLMAPLLYDNGGPIIMVQIENEYGSYGDDKVYLHHLVTVARGHLGDDTILYTTDGGSRETLEKGTIHGDAVFSAVDFTTGDEPWPIFKLQKEFNALGKSPPLSAEFYTGWLTHWGENIAKTDADFTAAALEKILSKNGSAVLYMAHGGTNFGFYSGANTGANESDYKPDLTSYDYDAPIQETGDVDNAKFKALRSVIDKYSETSLPSVPSNNEKTGYGRIQLQKTAFLFDTLNIKDAVGVAEFESPISMESAGQMFGFSLYVSEYTANDNGNILFIPEVHDRAQVFISCPSKDDAKRSTYIGIIERWSNRPLSLPYTDCPSNVRLFILVENMGRVNYGSFIFDRKGILSSVYLDGKILKRWKIFSVPFQNLNEKQKVNPIIEIAYSEIITSTAHKKLKDRSDNTSKEPTFYAGYFTVDKTSQLKDTFISFRGWGKGIAFVNKFNIGRYWPSFGPQCNLYVPAPILQNGKNVVVVLELESPHPELVVSSVDQPDFTCGPSGSRVHQL
ncbi:beta-galactosidase 17 isoform X2 [Camellia sinensis]|uniref:beta-galactosidase 17 isoform X2 n=1 Tax=Camellia sinensis TaxID=4442 RepID=UPI00103601D9|nr:beta-galactosidase 17 isoform X2 [Camellia sinensis]